ncbi:MAG: hypothetical protein R3C55_16335 [Parvularculaceae bacterium]
MMLRRLALAVRLLTAPTFRSRKAASSTASQEVTLIIGANTEDGRGNGDGLRRLSQQRRDPAGRPRLFEVRLPAGGDPDFGCSGSSTTPAGRFFTNTGDYTLDETGPGNTVRPRVGSDVFNNPTNFYQRPDERFTLGAFALQS